MAAFFRRKKPKYSTIPPDSSKKAIPEGLLNKCPGCGENIIRSQLEENLNVCPKCGYHHKITCYQRRDTLVDPHSFRELDADLTSLDPLGFVDSRRYAEKLDEARKKTGLNEAVITGEAELHGCRIGLGIMDFRFRGGSMGSVVGEKIARLAEYTLEHRLPLVIVSCSGGARMEEGMLSLMQMAKTSAAIGRHQRAGLVYISVLTDPTTGGVIASFASLGDVILAEPGAYIGFAGLRVIKETIKSELPEGFQTAEFLLEHGLIDRIVERRNLRDELGLLLDYFAGEPAEAVASSELPPPPPASAALPPSEPPLLAPPNNPDADAG